MFVCGPTVYDYPHIGHARTYLAFDIIVRYLKSQKIPIFYLQNITDIDDKIIARAKEKGVPPPALAKKFEKEYYKTEKQLGIKVTKHARATEHIKQIVKQVRTLVKKGHAYKIDGDGYYFDISTFPDYGKLSGRTTLQAEDAVSRIDESVKKKNKGDFALWKFTHTNSAPLPNGFGNTKAPTRIVINGEPAWRTPLGWGRPGWHIEDTAITEHYFGPQYDMHGGAVDLKFPHHEAEIAQQESASGKKPFVKIWMHTGFLLVNGRKMSKSLNNFITIEDFLKKNSASALRFIVASHHYRSPVDFGNKLAEQAEQALSKIRNFIFKLGLIKSAKKGAKNITEAIKSSEEKFREAMDDDFNTPIALAAVFEFINKIEPNVWKISAKDSELAAKFIMGEMSVLGFKFQKKAGIPLKIASLTKRRELYRVHKQFAQADALRKEIKALGYIIEDTPAGPLILRND